MQTFLISFITQLYFTRLNLSYVRTIRKRFVYVPESNFGYLRKLRTEYLVFRCEPRLYSNNSTSGIICFFGASCAVSLFRGTIFQDRWRSIDIERDYDWVVSVMIILRLKEVHNVLRQVAADVQSVVLTRAFTEYQAHIIMENSFTSLKN